MNHLTPFFWENTIWNPCSHRGKYQRIFPYWTRMLSLPITHCGFPRVLSVVDQWKSYWNMCSSKYLVTFIFPGREERKRRLISICTWWWTSKKKTLIGFWDCNIDLCSFAFYAKIFAQLKIYATSVVDCVLELNEWLPPWISCFRI